jgi:hypothetical protein
LPYAAYEKNGDFFFGIAPIATEAPIMGDHDAVIIAG